MAAANLAAEKAKSEARAKENQLRNEERKQEEEEKKRAEDARRTQEEDDKAREGGDAAAAAAAAGSLTDNPDPDINAFLHTMNKGGEDDDDDAVMAGTNDGLTRSPIKKNRRRIKRGRRGARRTRGRIRSR